MNTAAWKTFFAGLMAYAFCFGLAALPLFPKPLGGMAALQLMTAAVVASMLVASLRISGVDERIGDQGAAFTQALLGTVICCGLYSIVSLDTRPQILFIAFPLWTVISLMELSPRKVLILYAVNLAIYMDAFSETIFVHADPERYAQATFGLIIVTMTATVMYWRA